MPPVPSLFTFNLPNERIRELMGVVADPVLVRIAGTHLESTGPLLVTHWGLSGPAVLRLSAWGARELHERAYRFTVNVNWCGPHGEEAVRATLQQLRNDQPKRKLRNAVPYPIPGRLWEYLLHRVQIDPERTCETLGRKDLNRLVNTLTNDASEASGKTTFKEEFVTAGFPLSVAGTLILLESWAPTQAFISRAPSMCVASPAPWAAAATVLSCSTGQTAPPPILAVCSTSSSRCGGV